MGWLNQAHPSLFESPASRVDPVRRLARTDVDGSLAPRTGAGTPCRSLREAPRQHWGEQGPERRPEYPARGAGEGAILTRGAEMSLTTLPSLSQAARFSLVAGG